MVYRPGRVLGALTTALVNSAADSPRSAGERGRLCRARQAEFTKAVLHAPATRPGRYTILERLDLDERAVGERVTEFAAAVGSER